MSGRSIEVPRSAVRAISLTERCSLAARAGRALAGARSDANLDMRALQPAVIRAEQGELRMSLMLDGALLLRAEKSWVVEDLP
jgi:hypothetical protein